MVVWTLGKTLTSWVGPTLFTTGLKTRSVLLWMRRPSLEPYQRQGLPTPYMDMLCFLPYAQKVLSLTLYDESARAVTEYKRSTSKVEKALDATYDALFGKDGSPEDVEQQKEEQQSIADLRLQAFDDTFRPALIANDRFQDVNAWRYHPRILKWARQEWLISKYGPQVKEALDAYPQLRMSPQLARNPTQRMLANLARGRLDLSNDTPKQRTKSLLPSSDTLIKAFGIRDWATTKDTQRVRQSMVPIAQSLGGKVLRHPSDSNHLLNHADIPDQADLYDTSMEDVLQVLGGHVQHCGPLNTFCEEADIYQIWTQEYVQHLGDYLTQRSREFQSQQNGETIVLDVGAGDGLLTQFLQEHVSSKRGRKKTKQQPSDLPISFVSTDDGSWGIFAKGQVEKLSVQDSLSKYASPPATLESNETARQVIILCSWMPMGQDWSKLFREANVAEYILIGEADDGACGHNWETWGNPDFSPDDEEPTVVSTSDRASTTRVPPYETDGYQRWNMDVLSQFQFSRFDCAVSRNSWTVSFRRRN